MATRIVEQKLEWCEAKIIGFLTQNGYTVATTGDKERNIQGRYTRANRQGMLLRPRIEVALSPLPNQKTCVYIGFQLRGLAGLVVLFIWFLIGFGANLVMVGFAKRAGSWIFGLTPFLAALIWLPSCAWFAYCCVYRIAVPTHLMERHHSKTEQLLWEYLDPEDSYSHQIESSSRAWRFVFSFVKWAALLFVGIGGLGLVIHILFTNVLGLSTESISNIWFRVGIETWRDFGKSGASLIFLAGGAMLLSMAGWLTSAWALPHRYHWKVRQGSLYICWWTVVSLPCVLLALYATIPPLENASEPPALTERLMATQQSAFTGIVLFVQALALSSLLCVWPEDRDRENAKVFFAPPSTQYEWLSEQSVGKNIESMFKRHRLWTWAVFLLFNIVCYAGGFYLLFCLIESTAAMFGAKWALANIHCWPLLVQAEGKIAAAEAFLLTCLIGAPMSFSVIQMIQAYRKSRRKLTLAKRLGLDIRHTHLPPRPLECIRDRLRTDRILIVDLPDSLVNIKLEKKGLLRKYYILWVSLGARKALSESEMEALLWHECGHTQRLCYTLCRDVISLLVPWGPRFLDLTEDLYEQERAADLFAVKNIGNVEPLKTALRKVNSQQKCLPKKSRHNKHGLLKLRDGFDFLKVVWNLDWAGYLHPNVEQRLYWLEDCEMRAGMSSH